MCAKFQQNPSRKVDVPALLQDFGTEAYIYTSLLARARALRALARSEPSRVGTDRASRSSLKERGRKQNTGK